MDVNPIGTERRRAYRRRTGRERCFFCETNTEIEWHHVAGLVNNEGLAVPLCKKHHDILTEMQRTHCVDLRHGTDRSALEAVGHGLMSIGIFLMTLAIFLLECGRRLVALAADLDIHFPEWRKLPSAGMAEA